MPVPGYDPDDVEEALERMLGRRDPADYLTDEEIARWESDEEDLLDLLDDEDVERLLEKTPDDLLRGEPTES